MLVFAQIFAGCSHLTKDDLASNTDYKPALKSHFESRHDQAVKNFPNKESGGFITTVEKLWLNLINRTPDIGHAVEAGSTLEERTTLRISREAKSYFYQEAEDGYFPAEHEAILLHILAGFTFAAEGRRAEATIEARKASFYLQNEFGSSVPFDDPGLRLWLGTLWLYCGDWQHARVDFRVAAALSKDYQYLEEVAEKEQPPQSATLVLAGSGPQLVWTPSLTTNVAGGLQKVKFASYYKGEGFRLLSPGAEKKTETSVGPGLSTASWYDRHQERDHVIRQALDKSRYMVEAAGTASVAGVTQVAGSALAISLITLGIAGGLGIWYYAILSQSKEIAELGFYAGLIVAGAGIAVGSKVYDSTSRTSERIIHAGMSPVEHYRFVRFLPDFVHLGVGEKGSYQLVSHAGRRYDPLYQLSSPDAKTDIRLFFVPGGFYRDEVRSGGEASVAAKTKEAAGWIFSDHEVTFREAFRFCEKQAVSSGRKYRIPTESELRRALAGAFNDDGLAQEFSTYETVWARAAYVDSFTTCHHFDVKTNKQISNSPCSAQRRIICGDLGN